MQGKWLFLGCWAASCGMAWAADVPPLAPAEPQHWQITANRRVQLSGLLLNSHYREADTSGLTPDGVLNTECGHIKGNGLAVRWQGTVPWLPAIPQGIWAEWSYQHLSGRTRYQGYVQQGSTLTPYSAKTGNAHQAWQLRLGMPLPGLAAAESVQWVPYVQYGQHRWQRNLVQYSETFLYRWWAAGLLNQWRPQSPAINNWMFELDAAVGRHSHAHMQAPALGFAAGLPTKPLYRLGLSATYQWQPQWSVTAGWQWQKSHSGASAVVNGFQEPPSRNSQQQWVIGLNWLY